MKIPRLLFLYAITIIAVSWFSGTARWTKTKTLQIPKTRKSFSPDTKSREKMLEKAEAAKKFVVQKGYNKTLCFLIDMSLPSGQKRFFIYNFDKDTLQDAGLVAHGNCFQYWLEGRQYSNVVGSGCTSLGKYKIGSPYTGKWGYSYKLHGLDSSNHNAFERTVVLHGHRCIPDAEVTVEVCQSNGCPTVSPSFFDQLKKIINASSKPILLWIYE